MPRPGPAADIALTIAMHDAVPAPQVAMSKQIECFLYRACPSFLAAAPRRRPIQRRECEGSRPAVGNLI
jgi:hypothetical protein